jgi:ATP-dependent Clp protease ATP-binding subunit ClpX
VVNAEVVTGDATPLYIYAKSKGEAAPKQGA